MKPTDIELYKNIIRQHWRDIIFLMTIPVLLFMVVFIAKSYYENQDKLDNLNATVQKSSDNLQTVQANSVLAQKEIDDNNELLTQLVPLKEDYFTIIYALEKLANDTGFTILKYGIDLSRSSPEQLSIAVEGDGNSDHFMKFLRTYEFGGGRLITSEKLEYSEAEKHRVKLNLNFYNKKTGAPVDQPIKLTEKDIELMKQIKSKTQVIVKYTGAEDNYPTKSNPF